MGFAVRIALPSAVLAVSISALGVLTSCDGTSSGDTGDPIHKPVPTELGQGQRVHDVVGDAVWLNDGDMTSSNCQVPAARQVGLTGQVIVAVDRFDETGGGQTGNIYVEDVPQEGADPVPYSGMEIFNAGFTPPDLRVFEGDVVDTLGSYTEFLGPSTFIFNYCRTLPETSGTLTFRFENGYRPAATIVKAGSTTARWDSVRGYKNARRWLSMLVRFEQVTLPNAPKSSKGRYSVDIDIGGGVTSDEVVGISNELYDLESEGLAAGDSLKSVTGILTYFHGFKIAPRSAADIER
jgi:hypothetical protein